ncbi:MAG: DedA family protein [Zoogloeaceae bacterium]|jgi:membrane-associated protein|nr:DedA family protein [Zoogloeaceae bacterium]
MELAAWFFDLILHLDQHLDVLTREYDVWIYLILFAIVFSETGFVVTPFLPGDSLLFVAGALAVSAAGESAAGMNIWVLTITLSAAAILGNTLNYHIGRFIGPKVFQWENSRFFNRSALVKTQEFYARHGGKTLVISRFLPLFRTFAPFVAGVGAMPYGRFALFNACGAIAWVFSLCFAGYWFGNLPWVRRNFSLLILVIIAFSLLPILFAWVRARIRQRKSCEAT